MNDPQTPLARSTGEPKHRRTPEAQPQPIATKLLHLRRPAAVGDWIDAWRVRWSGGWDRQRLFFIVIVEEKRR